ncbi:transforming growth factor-beta receptor-associated protein 1 [Betta splendens]|uniref:Transforming growth factor-beta receptor-associated protein 1 n=1 Tax=Betta splendens TaxID=158456 RepID=A0A6P7LNP3_BETSP|nr:transforming growth factor-beta receptor-associated protein 1 [Betta splendens]
MAFKAFTQTRVFVKRAAPKEKDKSCIQCLECHGPNVYLGTKDATVQHLILPSAHGELGPVQSPAREGRMRKLGSSGPVVHLRTVPLFNHLLVLWDRGVSALNMFSLEPVPALPRIQHVSLFEVRDTPLAVQMLTASSRRKAIWLHVVGVDKWEAVKEIPLPQDPVAFALDGASLCVGTCNRYLLCDIQSGCTGELFPHSHSRERVFVASVGRGEFLLNGPESLGVFVMETGICQRPPLQWPQEVLAAGVCFPYIVALQPQALCVYSLLDQQHKLTLGLSGARGLLPVPDGVLVFTDRDISSLRLVPLEEQIQALVELESFEEALLLLDGVHSRRPIDSYKERQKAITCLAGFAHFYQEGFSEARDLFIKGELDPREIIHLFPGMRSLLCGDFQPQYDGVNKGRALQVLWQDDSSALHRYLAFLGEFLRAVSSTERGLRCGKEVDSALLRLYTELGDAENLQQLAEMPNKCLLDHCVPVLEQHNRYFALGSLYQSHGKHTNAIETWVKIADGFYKDPSCSDVYGHIVWTLSRLQDREAVWEFAEWTVRRNQEMGVRIFTLRPLDAQLEVLDVLALLEKYPRALILYLEFLIHDLNNEEERHHSRLALAYVSQALHEEADLRATRGKLQQLLWESRFYDVSAVHERVKSTALHVEEAIVLSRAGDHARALQVLVHQERDVRAAEAFCSRAARGRGSQRRRALLLSLLQIYLGSEQLAGAAADLLNRNPRVFRAETAVQLLPEAWSVQLVSRFLVGSLRESLHQRRTAKLRAALCRAELLRHKVIRMQASRTKLALDAEQKCSVCQGCFAEPQFARNPRGELMHTGCAGFLAP